MTSKKRAGNSKEGEIQKNESAFAEISFANLRFGVSFISGFLDHDLFGLVDIGIDVISWMFFFYMYITLRQQLCTACFQNRPYGSFDDVNRKMQVNCLSIS